MPISKRRLRPRAVDAKARHEAKRIAEDWQSAGLAVDLVEYFATATDTGGYGLTARSSTSVLSCRCQSWLYRRRLFGRARPLWTIAVSVRAGDHGADLAQAPPARQAGFAAAWEHQRAWDQVQGWIDGAGTLPATLEDALERIASGSADLGP
jgi:hypothetical protein